MVTSYGSILKLLKFQPSKKFTVYLAWPTITHYRDVDISAVVAHENSIGEPDFSEGLAPHTQ